MATSFALPVDVPWYLIAASPDMMDTTFCGGAILPAWQSSLAIYAYEPPPDDLPAELCNQKITYLKVTCSITGYQPNATETQVLNYPPAGENPAPVVRFIQIMTVPTSSPYQINLTLPGYMNDLGVSYYPAGTALQSTGGEVSSSDLQQGQYSWGPEGSYTFSAADAGQQVQIECDYLVTSNTDPSGDFTDDYFACYGVLVNVAVFSSTTTVPQTSSTPNMYGFYDNTGYYPAGYQFPNPYQTGAYTISSPPGGPPYPTSPTSLLWTAADGFQVTNAGLQIDIPASINVVLQMILGPSAAGTITAYRGNVQVFTAPLPQSTGGIQSVPITPNNAASSVTRIVLQLTQAGNCFLYGMTYSIAERPITLADYPHIIDFEPKTRDLYQAATDQNEILTGSNSSVNTGKSLSNTASSQMGLALGFNSGSGTAAAAAGAGAGAGSSGTGSGGSGSGGPTVSGQFTSSWGNAATDSATTQIDQSRQMRETQGSSTNITQQYNLLTGYHAGTNRATFLMLPRPHTLQATDYRTFVRGLRMIEGLQDFFLIISRPTTLPGICVEASLETAHFPENVVLAPAPSPTGPAPQTTTYPVSQLVYAPGGNLGAQSSNTTTGGLPQPDSWTVNQFPSDYQLDTSKGGSSPQVTPVPVPSGWTPPPIKLTLCPGVSCNITPGPGHNPSEYWQALLSLTGSVSSPDGISVSFNNIEVNSNGLQGAGAFPASECNASAMLNFTIYGVQQPQTSSSSPDLADGEQNVVVSDFLVASCDLCACMNSCSSNNCVMIAPPQQVPYYESPGPNQATASPGSPASTSSTSTTASTAPATPSGNSASVTAAAMRTAPSISKLASMTPTGRARGKPAPASGHPATPSSFSKRASATTPSLIPPISKPGSATSIDTATAVSPPNKHGGRSSSSIVYETKLKLPRRLLSTEQLRASRTPVARELMNRIQHHMLNSWRMPQRRPHHAVGFLESDYLCERLRKRMPKAYLARRVSDVPSLSSLVVKHLGAKSTVGDVLALDLYHLRVRSKATLEESIRTRRILLGFGEAVTMEREDSGTAKAGAPAKISRTAVGEEAPPVGKKQKKAYGSNKVKADAQKKPKRRDRR